MHTDSSLKVLDDITTTLGDSLCFFAEETSGVFDTVELDKEYFARGRVAARSLRVPAELEPGLMSPVNNRACPAWTGYE